MKDRSNVKSPGIMGGDGRAADVLRGEYDMKNTQIVCGEYPVDLCFYGDSITYLCEWGAYYGRFGTCINRGICGDAVHIMRRRFEADVLQLHPKLCVMMGGINNTWIVDEQFGGQEPPREFVEEKVLDLTLGGFVGILEACKDARQPIVLCSILPVREPVAFAERHNRLVKELNEGIQRLCRVYQVPYVDYHSQVVDADGLTLRAGLADDGLHPHHFGYVEMQKALLPVLEEFFK